MKTRRHHNNNGRQMIKSGSRALTTERLARNMGIPFMHKHAKNVHEDTDNERTIISTMGLEAILENGDGAREEWVQCEPNDPRRGVRVDGKTYRFVKMLMK